MAGEVDRGVYRFFSAADMDEEKARYIDAVKYSASDVASDSVDGEAFSYGPRRDMNLDEWGNEIQLAYVQLNPSTNAFPASRAVADMT